MFVILLRIEPQLALLSLSGGAGHLPVRRPTTPSIIQPRVVDVRHLESMSLSIVHEAMTMMRVIVAFGREGHEWRRFRKPGRAGGRGAGRA